MPVAHQPLAAVIGELVGMAADQGGNLRLDGLRQQRSRAVAQHLGQRIGECSWLGELENISLCHGVSLLRWRSGSFEHPHDTPPYPFMPSPTFVDSSGHAPAKVDAVALHRRRVEHGHLSVGLKIHCLGDGSQFATLVEGLGGAQKILDVNYFKHSHASLCLVLPPVGSARSAILLLECIEHFIGSPVFSNPEIQIQVCSPGRLDARRSALLAIGFYLGSDTLRRYTLGDFATSFAKHQRYPRGRRLVLYDAEGDFDG